MAVLLACSAGAADAPGLSGRWSLVVENAEAGAPSPAPHLPETASSGWGREITIAQEPGRVTIERHQFAELDIQPPMRFVYLLGGPESRNVVNMGRGPQEQVARATLERARLVLSSRHGAGTDVAADVTQVLSIDASDALVVETTRTARGVTATTKARYRRQPAPAPK